MNYRLAFLISLVCHSAFANPVLTTNLLLNPGGEAGTLTNWVAGGDSGPHLDNGTFDPSITPHSGTNDFLGGRGAVGTLTQVVPLVANQGITVGSIDTGALLASVSFWEQGLNQGGPGDDGYVSLVFMDSASNTISGWSAPEVDAHLGVWSNYSAYLPIPAGTRFIQYSMTFIRHAGGDLDGFIDDNFLAVIDSIPQPALSASVSGTNVIVSWPAAYSDGFQLLQNTNLVATNWTQVTNSVQTSNGTNQVVIVQPVGRVFFRLFHP